MTTETCTARNGTYTCALPEDHTHAHRTEFTEAGVLKAATWWATYGPVVIRPVVKSA